MIKKVIIAATLAIGAIAVFHHGKSDNGKHACPLKKELKKTEVVSAKA